MKVSEIMNTSVKTVTADTSVNEVSITMCFNQISGLPVLNDNGDIIGIISEKDVLRAMYPAIGEFMEDGKFDFETLESSYTNVLNYRVGDLMTKQVHTIDPDFPVLKAVSIMCLKKVRRIPVAKNGKLVGIVSIGDVHKAIFKESLSAQSELAAPAVAARG